MQLFIAIVEMAGDEGVDIQLLCPVQICDQAVVIEIRKIKGDQGFAQSQIRDIQQLLLRE